MTTAHICWKRTSSAEMCAITGCVPMNRRLHITVVWRQGCRPWHRCWWKGSFCIAGVKVHSCYFCWHLCYHQTAKLWVIEQRWARCLLSAGACSRWRRAWLLCLRLLFYWLRANWGLWSGPRGTKDRSTPWSQRLQASSSLQNGDFKWAFLYVTWQMWRVSNILKTGRVISFYF